MKLNEGEMMAQSESQKRAQQKYNQKNKLKRRISSYHNSARVFIRSYASDDDLNELTQLIKERYRINKMIHRLDGIRDYINRPDFSEHTHDLQVFIWSTPAALLTDRKSNGAVDVDWDAWFQGEIAARFNKEEPVVELKRRGKSKFYTSNRAFDILDWLY